MNKLKVLELFAGQRCIGRAFEERGHSVFSVDYAKYHSDIDWYADIGTISAEDIRSRFGKLYAAALRAAKAMGYRRAITYTLPSESGASLKAVGFILDGETAYTHSWNVPSRPRAKPEKYPTGTKNRWIKTL